jgi:hypothetical protein
VGAERLIEFSFTSRIARDHAPADLLRLARQAWGDNLRAGLTGVMRLEAGRMEQTVEGPAAVVLALAARILTDRRHGEIVVRAFGPIAARRFADWRAEGFGAAAGAPRGGAPLRLVAPTRRPAAEPQAEAAAQAPLARAT